MCRLRRLKKLDRIHEYIRHSISFDWVPPKSNKTEKQHSSGNSENAENFARQAILFYDVFCRIIFQISKYEIDQSRGELILHAINNPTLFGAS